MFSADDWSPSLQSNISAQSSSNRVLLQAESKRCRQDSTRIRSKSLVAGAQLRDLHTATPYAPNLSENNLRWLPQFCEQRNIRYNSIHNFTIRSLYGLLDLIPSETLLAISEVLGPAYVRYREDLPEEILDHVLFSANSEERIEADIYREYFLLRGSGRQQSSRSIKRVVKANIELGKTLSLPPICVSTTTASREVPSALCSADGCQVDVRRPPAFQVSHLYACTASLEDRTRSPDRIAFLPGFRTTSGLDRRLVLPPYLLQQSKSRREYAEFAREHLMLLSAGCLYERLLLRVLSRKPTNAKHIELDDTCRVYAMTCCGELTTVYAMVVRDVWGERYHEHKSNEPIVYDFCRLHDFNIADTDQCKALCECINSMHLWAIYSHYDSVLEDGMSADTGVLRDPEDLASITFRYGKKKNTLTFSPCSPYEGSVDEVECSGPDDGGVSLSLGGQAKQGSMRRKRRRKRKNASAKVDNVDLRAQQS